MRVVVTGASGFVGRGLCRWLAQSHTDVVAVSRQPQPVAGVQRMVRIEGLHDAAGLERACEGADAVVHLAARVHVMRENSRDPLAAFRQVNVDGTRSVCRAAISAGVRRVVFVSSIKVLGEGRLARYTEADGPAPRDPYGQSKLEAEQVVAETVQTPASWTVVRPPLVYGPGVGGNFQRLLRLAQLALRIPLPLGGIDNRRSMIGGQNLSALLAVAARHPAAANRAYLVSDGEDLSTSELIVRLAAALGGRARLVGCPLAVLRAFGRAMGRAEEVARLTESLTVDSSPVRRELAWVPTVGVDEELRAVASWWQALRSHE